MGITLTQAEAVIDAVLEEARRRDMPPLSVAVLDEGAHLKALRREDGCSFLRARICRAKAFGALGLGVDSRTIAERHDADPRQRGFIQGLNAMTSGGVVPLPGGVLILDAAGVVLGAVGVAGGPSEDDEACAVAGVRAAGLRTAADART